MTKKRKGYNHLVKVKTIGLSRVIEDGHASIKKSEIKFQEIIEKEVFMK